MFEHSLYDQEPVEPPQEGDLFNKYEIKNWEIGPRIYKIFAISALANLLALLFVAQTSLLTMKGCDSPFVGSVCQVLDTIYLGTMLYGTDRQYVDAAYNKTLLSNSDVTFIDVSGVTPPLSYPEGYFQLANPLEYQAKLDAANNPLDPNSGFYAPGIPVSKPFPSNSLLNTKPHYPKQKADVVDGPLPTGIGDSSGGTNPTINRRKGSGGGRVVPTTNPDGTTLEKKVDPSAAVDAVVINREPLKVFGKGVAEKLDKKEVDLSSNFEVVAEGVLTKDGKLDTSIDKKTKEKKSRIVNAQGDQKMVTVVTDAIAAISDSGWLGYLRTVGIVKINFTFTQTDNQLLATITSEQLTPERANTLSSQLSGFMSAASLADRAGFKKLGDDEKVLLQNAKATSNGKKVVLNFALPKPVAQEMIQRNIQKAREAQTGSKPSGKLTGEGSDDQNSGK